MQKPLLLPVLFVFALFGCSDDNNTFTSTGTTDTAQNGSTATVRVLHGSPDAPNVDVLVDGEVVLEDVPYKAASPYLDVPADGFDIAVNPTGTDDSVLEVDDVMLTADTPHTIIALNYADQLEALVLDDSNSGPAAGELLVRVVHGAPSAPAVDVYVTGPDDDLAAAEPAVTGAAFKDATDFIALSEGEYRIRVTAEGDDEVIYDSGAVELAEGNELTVVALEGEANAVSPITLVALTGDSDNPTLELGDDRARVRAAHLSPDAPNVDVLVDGDVVLEDVAFRDISEYLPLNSGTYDVQVNVAGTSDVVLSETLELGQGEVFTFAAVDFVASLQGLVIEDDLTAPDEGNAHIRVFHASPDAPNVDVLVDEETVLTDVAFTDVSDYLPVSAGDHRVTVNVAGTSDSVIDETLTFEEGGIYTIIAANDVANLEAIVVHDNAFADDGNGNGDADDGARVRAAHLSPDAPNVDVLVNGDMVLENVAFETVSDYLALEPGSYDIEVNVAGSSDTVLSETIDVAQGDAFTLAAINFVSDIEALLIEDDLTPPEEGNAHVRVFHASPDAPNVDVLVDGDVVLEDVAFRDVSDYLPVPAGKRHIKVNIAGTTDCVINVKLELEDGGIYTVIAADEVANLKPLAIRDN